MTLKVITNPHIFHYSYSTLVKNKPDKFPTVLTDASSWHVASGTVQQLSDHIKDGYPWMPALLKEGASKKSDETCKALYCLAVDIDNTTKKQKDIVLSLELAKEHPFVQAHAGLVQESPSSTPDWPKFRIVFPLYEPLFSKENINTAYIYLHSLIPGCDPACKDPQRIYYGAQGTEPAFISLTNTLPPTFLEEAIAFSSDARKKAAKQAADRARYRERQATTWRQKHGMSEEELVVVMSSYFPRREKGTGTYDQCFRALCALVNTFGPAKAIEIAENSPLASRPEPEQEWNVPKKVESISKTVKHSSRKILFGTLVMIAQSNGWEYPSAKLNRVKETSTDYKNDSYSTSIEIEQNDDDEYDQDDIPSTGWKAPMVRNRVLFDKDVQLSNFSLKLIANLRPPVDEPSLNGSCLVQVCMADGQTFTSVLSNKDQGSVKDILSALSRTSGAPTLFFQGDRRQLVAHLGEQAQRLSTTTKAIANRIGRQSDGSWIFPEPTPEFQSPDWIYLGRYEQTPPYYKGFQPQAKGALKTFLLSLKEIVTERYFNQVIFLLGWTLAALNRQQIESRYHFFPIVNAYGTNGTGKSYAASICASLTGQRTSSPETYAYLLALLNDAYDYPLFFDDPANSKSKAANFDYADLTRRCFQLNAGGNSLDRHRTAYRPLALFTNFQLSADLPSQVRVLPMEFLPSDKPDQRVSPSTLNALFDNLSSSFLEFTQTPWSLDEVKNVDESEIIDNRTSLSISLVRYFSLCVANHFGLGLNPETLDAYIVECLLFTQHEQQQELDLFEQLDEFLVSEISKDSLHLGPWAMRIITVKDYPSSLVAIAVRPLQDSLRHSTIPLDYTLLKMKVKSLYSQSELQDFANFTNFNVRYPHTRETYRASLKPSEFTLPPQLSTQMKSLLIPIEYLPATTLTLESLDPLPDN